MPARTRGELGKHGEECACRELERRGYAILERRHRTRFGEIDIIATDRGVLVFVEVKARRTTTYGPPAEAVTWQKQRRLVGLAQMYLATSRLTNVPCRFDVVSVWFRRGSEKPQVEVLKGAFGVC
jgi:putative endonuclease